MDNNKFIDENNHQTTEKLIEDFYNWLIMMIKEKYGELEINNCIYFNEEYEKLIYETIAKREDIKSNVIINLLNDDSIQRLKKILNITKEEYSLIGCDDKKDMVYFNQLIGWYEAIPKETNMFINSLYSKQ